MLWSGASICFSDWWGGKSKKKFNIFSAQNRNIKLCAQCAPQNLKLCMFSSIFMLNLMVSQPWQCFLNLFLHYILLICQVVKIIGGGGAKSSMFAPPPPPKFFGGVTSPPQDRCLFSMVVICAECAVALKSRCVNVKTSWAWSYVITNHTTTCSFEKCPLSVATSWL